MRASGPVSSRKYYGETSSSYRRPSRTKRRDRARFTLHFRDYPRPPRGCYKHETNMSRTGHVAVLARSA